jgi:hypothetical protein
MENLNLDNDSNQISNELLQINALNLNSSQINSEIINNINNFGDNKKRGK